MEKDTQQNKNIRHSVLDKIKDEKLRMKPKSYYVAKTSIELFGILLILVALLYLMSFIFFVLDWNIAWSLPSLGLPGIFIFLQSFPWLLLLLVAIFIVLLEVAVKHFAITYRRPLLYSVLAITGLVLVSSFILAKAPLHRSFLERAHDNHLPFAGKLYRSDRLMNINNVHYGEITEVTDGGFFMITKSGTSLTVKISDRTDILAPDALAVNSLILVIGDEQENIIEATIIKKLEKRHMMPRRQKPLKFNYNSIYLQFEQSVKES